jgi:hypothetical protein
VAASEVISFEPYRLIPAERLLLKGEVVNVGNRALDILVALAKTAGDVVSQKRDVFALQASADFLTPKSSGTPPTAQKESCDASFQQARHRIDQSSCSSTTAQTEIRYARPTWIGCGSAPGQRCRAGRGDRGVDDTA